MYQVLRRRDLIGKLNLRTRAHRDFGEFIDETFLEYCKKEYGDISIAELRKKDTSLYKQLVKRRLTNNLLRSRINWKNLTDDELIKYIKDNYGSISSGELYRQNRKLYATLFRRNLLPKFRGLETSMEQILDEHIGGEHA